jgi:hypothetical protein
MLQHLIETSLDALALLVAIILYGKFGGHG